MSSDDVVIQVEGLGKCFSVYDRPADRLKQLILPRVKGLMGLPESGYCHDYWVFSDLSFEVKRGESVGIIGRNGSGKSTLLQIIAGTMAPTQGSVDVKGRVGALLELGSGFNPEFTGRENVFLNGILLGLSKGEIEQKFDYIASFADIGEYLDQPVKTYSSGMMLRLAFAVQVAVDVEVLIIDEALAVGDALFQLKCFRRLEEIKANGTTILFVSHATDLVRSFCDYGLVLDKGKSVFWGEAKGATVKYLELLFPNGEASKLDGEKAINDAPERADEARGGFGQSECLTINSSNMGGHAYGVGGAKLDWLEIYGLEKPNVLVGGRSIKVCSQFSWQSDFLQELIDKDGYNPNVTLGIALTDKKGTSIFGCNGFDYGLPIDCGHSEQGTVEFRLVLPYLMEGDYFLTVAIALGDLNHHVQLQWYDCVLPLKYLKTDKNVFGILSVDYEMEKKLNEGVE